jgi:hypothetical protein
MSNELINESQLEDRIRSFWSVLRNAGPIGISDDVDDILAGVTGMIFSHEYPENFSSRGIVNLAIAAGGTYEGDLCAFCDNHRNGEELKCIFDTLRARIPNAGLFVRFMALLSGVSEGLTKKQVGYLARHILDQALERNRTDGGNFLATREIAQLMLRLTESEESQNSDVFIPYIPYPGTPSLVDAARITCCVSNLKAATIMAVYQLIEGGTADVQTLLVSPEHDSGLFPRHQKFGRIIATPPFGMRLRSHWSGHTDTETFCIDQIVQNLMGIEGSAAICVSPGILFRSAQNNLRFRRNLIGTGLVEAVIQLPERLFRYTSIAPAIIVLRRGIPNYGKIRVIDATDCVVEGEGRPILDVEKVIRRVKSIGDHVKTRDITESELESCDYDLSPARHLLPKEVIAPEGHTLVTLGDILKIVRMPQPQPSDRGVLMERKAFPDTTLGFEFSFTESPQIQFLTLENAPAFRKISSSCLLVDTMAFRGEIRAFWFSHQGKDLFVRPDIRPMEIDEQRADPRWVAMALNSKDVSEQVRSMLTGAGIPRLRIELLLNMRVALPDSLEKQRAIVRSAEELQIKAKAKEIGFEKLLEQQKEDFRRDIQLKKHTLSQIARDIRSRVSVIKNALDQAGKLQSEQPIGRQQISVVDYLDHIAKRCDDMGKTLESLTKIDDFSPLEELSLEAAFKSLKAICKGRQFKLETEIHNGSFKDQATGRKLKPIINIASKDFTELCENIFDNAERHGFRGKSADHLVRIDAFLDTQEQMVVVSFKNTGEPLPQGLTIDRFVTRGEKGGTTGNTGIGGHHIKSLMDHANGKIDIRNLAEDLFQVEVKLTFPFQP